MVLGSLIGPEERAAARHVALTLCWPVRYLGTTSNSAVLLFFVFFSVFFFPSNIMYPINSISDVNIDIFNTPEPKRRWVQYRVGIF